MNIYTTKINEMLCLTERIISDNDEMFNIFTDKYVKLSNKLELIRVNLKNINDDLQADAKAEDEYISKKESEEDRKLRYMEQNEIQQSKWGEGLETIGDDILNAVRNEVK